MHQLSLDVMRTFVTIAEVGSFQKAGDLLGRTQPAISLQMKKLEQMVERSLFEKNGQSYQLNNDGKWLLTQAKAMLAINDDVFRQFGKQRLQGKLRLGIPNEFASTLLPSIIGEFSQRYPDVTLEVTSALSRELLADKNADMFDLILALIPSEQEQQGEIVLNDELVWVGDPNHRIADKSIQLVVAPNGCVYRSRIIEKLKRQTHTWKITFTNADLYGLVAAIQQGLGITALAKSSLPAALSIIKNPRLPVLGRINICLINQDTQQHQISTTLADFIKARLKR